jgi:prevent-host-death family protein
MQINVHEAKTKLSALIASVENGDEVILARAGKPVARIVPYVKKRGGMALGLASGSAFNIPAADTLAAMDREIEDSFYESSVFPVHTVQESTPATYAAPDSASGS